jgi:hypothetical protein
MMNGDVIAIHESHRRMPLSDFQLTNHRNFPTMGSVRNFVKGGHRQMHRTHLASIHIAANAMRPWPEQPGRKSRRTFPDFNRVR